MKLFAPGSQYFSTVRRLNSKNMIIKKITGHLCSIPLQKTFTYFTASLTHLPYVLIEIEVDSGLIGIGEAALAWDVTGETQGGALECVDLIRPLLVGSSIDTLTCVRAITDNIRLTLYGNTALKTGIESALLDLLGRRLHLPIYKILGGKEKKHITLQCTFSFEEIESNVFLLARDAYIKGVRIFKFKVGRDCLKESKAIRDIRNTYPDVTITLDANQAWNSASHAQNFLKSVKDVGIAWVEQPLRASDYEGLAFLRHRCGIPVMADESCHTLHDLKILHLFRAIDCVNLKLAKCGGLFEFMRMIEFCEENGIRYALGDMIHSSVGTAYNLHAATLGNFLTYDLTRPDRILKDCGEGLVFKDFTVYIPDTPGLGVYLKDDASGVE